MLFNRSITAVSLVAFLSLSSALCAQRTKTPTLEEILQRLEANLNHYDTSVPSFFCDEHVVSQMQPGPSNRDTVTDSIFRLKRTSNADRTTTLAESREIRKVNGKPAASQKMDGPTMLNGAFEGGLAFVSLSQQACMNYTLQRVHRKRPNEPYIVRFTTDLTPPDSANCVLQENSKGRVFIDPASMQITRLELTTPHHIIIPKTRYLSAVVGERTLAVDYAPVRLGGETFWMPSKITMRNISGAQTFHPTSWSFEASYSNYHKLEVRSHVLPGYKTPAQ